MKSYIISLAVGLLVGGLYSLLGVRSPAPPAVALIGLLGMLIGEQATSTVTRRIGGDAPIAVIPPSPTEKDAR